MVAATTNSTVPLYFRTSDLDRVKVPVVSAAQMRELDARAEAAGLTGVQMTESDARCVLEFARQTGLLDRREAADPAPAVPHVTSP